MIYLRVYFTIGIALTTILAAAIVANKNDPRVRSVSLSRHLFLLFIHTLLWGPLLAYFVWRRIK